jgi:hypothetical protein
MSDIKNKIIAIDFDGVFNHIGESLGTSTPQSWNEKGHLIMNDPEKVFMFNKMIDEYGFGVILSSSWRYHNDWRGQMKSNGFVFEFIDRIPIKLPNCIKTLQYGSPKRGDYLQYWLDNHPEVENYAILDDYDDFHEWQQEHFFKTKSATGLTDEIADRVIKYLNSNKKYILIEKEYGIC